jgi:hypothetical protein
MDAVRAALPLTRDSVAVVHLGSLLLRDFMEEAGTDVTAVLLRADLTADRALTALAVRELATRALRVRVLKRPLAWVPARRALFGVLAPESSGGLSLGMSESLLESRISAAHACYSDRHDAQADSAGTEKQQR